MEIDQSISGLPLVSVIITTKNEEKNMDNCLESVRRQTYPCELMEIIVVDNCSMDRTREIGRKYTPWVFEKGPERSAQRNFGILKSSGEYILCLDADMILASDVIRQCVLKSRDGGYVGLYIPERIVGNGFWIKVRDFERSFYNESCIDCVRFFSRQACLEIGGFDEGFFVGEDWDFDRRIKELGRTGIIDALLYHNEGEFNFKRYLRKKSFYSGNFSGYVSKWGKQDEIVQRQLGFWYRFVMVFVEKGKWKKLMRHPILTVCMYGLRFLVAAVYLIRRKRHS